MSSTSEVGFLKSLFDFQLRHYITLRVLRVLYVIMTVLILLGSLIFILVTLINSGPRALGVVIVVPLGALLFLILLRLSIESLANLQRIGDNTQKMVEQNSSN
jgi:hypothetical protein